MGFFEKVGYSSWLFDEYDGNVYIADTETYELLYLNASSCKVLGKPLEQLVGCKCYEAIQGRTSPCPFCTNDCLVKDSFYEWEFYNPHLERTFLIKNRLIDWDGRKARLEMSADNYSLQYRMEKKEQEQNIILGTIPGGFVRVDARDLRTVIWYGGEFLKLIDYTREQFEQEMKHRCDYVHPEDIERITEIMLKSKETGKATMAEGRIITQSGEVKVLTMTYYYVGAEDSWDGIASYYSMGINVTEERKEQERQRRALEDAVRTARVANTAKTNFLSSMSHDIRTPMNVIMGMAAIARANLDSKEKVQDCLAKIDTSGQHLLSLINEVLDMSKIESGKIELMTEVVNLPELLQNITDMCRPLIMKKNQEFRFSIGRLYHEDVMTDGNRLQQILMNLLSNAIKYTPEGGTITLKINELDSRIPAKGQYEFICMDTGIGIADEYIPMIFEPFWRAEDPRISKLQGTGLGMTITENIVRMMNGTIEVQSRQGEGSTFTVSLPLEVCRMEEAAGEELAGLSVLVVDEDRTTCERAAALLNEFGMKGTWVASEKEAAELVIKAHEQNNDFYAVILDWRVPKKSEYQVLSDVRKKLGQDIPVIIISADNDSDIEEKLLHIGADAFITKPLFKSKMVQVLRLFADQNKADGSTAETKEKQAALSGKHILLAEDNELNREIIVEILTMQGIKVTETENGLEAKQAFEASRPGEYDAILMDIQMPVMNGYDAVKAIRTLGREDALKIPIFALTADAFATDVTKARSVGMNEHIAKPIDIDHLLEVLRCWLT